MDMISPAGAPSALLHPDRVSALRPAPELSVVVPTFNERQSVPILVARLAHVLAGCDWEVVFVDDNSPDGTAAVADKLGEADGRVCCISRDGRHGPASACLRGMSSTAAPYVAVIDADLQYDENLLVAMLEKLRAGAADLVVARRVIGPDAPRLLRRRAHLARWSNATARRLLGTDVSDPLSGCFMIRRDAFAALAPALAPQGAKILLDILTAARGRLRVAELPCRFDLRRHGDSKLGGRTALDLAALTTAKLTWSAVPPRFAMFCMVGLSGVGIHMATLSVALLAAGLPFTPAQTLAAIAAMAWNFTLNNLFTYHDRRLAGRAFLAGMVRFQMICGIGAIANVGVASVIFGGGRNWWIAGLAGVVTGAVWNYAVTSVFVWRKA
jgi:dolichol-phosphate mannosyltransferase